MSGKVDFSIKKLGQNNVGTFLIKKMKAGAEFGEEHLLNTVQKIKFIYQCQSKVTVASLNY